MKTMGKSELVPHSSRREERARERERVPESLLEIGDVGLKGARKLHFLLLQNIPYDVTPMGIGQKCHINQLSYCHIVVQDI